MITNSFLDQKWLDEHLKKIKKNAGSRYTPELNVDLPISDIFNGLCRTPEFYYTIRQHVGKFIRAFRYIQSQYENKAVQRINSKFHKEAENLIEILEAIKEFDTKVFDWKKINRITKKVDELSWQLSDKLRELKDAADLEKSNKKEENKSISEKLSSDIHYLYELKKEIRFFEELSSSTRASLSNKPNLLLTGIAGTGKTHLLCDVVENHIHKTPPRPSLLVFGEFFNNSDDPWEQIIKLADLKLTKRKFLELLDQAGKKSKVRSLLIIDALNETRGKSFWRQNLSKVVDEVRKYPHIALVLSIRSGFEKEVLTKKQRSWFIHEEHRGFQFREWEAVSKFFKEFNLPFPEIPLLMPEFQNPLFLLLFCKAFKDRAKKSGNKKEIFRGHEGATYIFESFVDSVSNRITKKFSITGNDRNVWDKVIEKVAEEMMNNSDDRISEGKLISIVATAYPSINTGLFIKELEQNLLIVKIPSNPTGFDYRFPFQKFSDHLLGRYLFKKYEIEFGRGNKNIKDVKKFFSKRRKLGKYLSSSWNRGLVEALSIQCPERLNGLELIDIASYLKQADFAQESFVESLIWRKPSSFSADLKNTKDYINNFVIRSEYGHSNLLNALLSVAPIPNHPFNADFLQNHLSRFSLAERDSWWSTFLHRQYGNQGTVDRLVEWGWSNQDKSQISDDSLRLCSTALVWFLTSPNRFLRDKTTKALVSILTGRLNVVISLLTQFVKVNDPYVLERLYAVAYGCALRTKNNDRALATLAMWVYKTNFDKGKPPVDILIRDYARGIIEVALNRKIVISIDKKKILPPFSSSWSKMVPSEKYLRKKYYPETFFKDKSTNRGFLDIWSSVMYSFGSLADWGNYVLDSAVNHWSGRRLGGKEPNRKVMFEVFKKSLNKDQARLLGLATNPYYGIDMATLFKSMKVKTYTKDTLDEEKVKKEEQEQKDRMTEFLLEFENSLSKNKRDYFKQEIKPFLDDRGGVNDPLERFNTGLAQRWVFNRVVQLGWSYKLHGQFDERIDSYQADRTSHKAERIGKKYQWIAMHELLARIADNFEFKEEDWSHDASNYNGPWQLSIRDIDPSCTLKEPPNNISMDVPAFTNHLKKIAYEAWDKKISDMAWLKKETDLLPPELVIEFIDDNNQAWLLLEGFKGWENDTPPEQERFNLPTRELWYLLKGYIVQKGNSRKVFEWAKNQDFMGRWMPESHEFYDIYLGEYPWAPAFIDHYIPYYNHDDWTQGTRGEKIPVKILVADDEYLSSGSSRDCSTSESIGVKLPAKWIVDNMNLVQNYVDGRFFDKSGQLIAFDPHIFDQNMPSCVFLRKNTFTKFLIQKNYSIFWTILGEKNLIGGRGNGRSPGRLELTGAYSIDVKNKIIGSVKYTFKKF